MLATSPVDLRFIAQLRQDGVLLDSIEGGIHFKELSQDGTRSLVAIYARTPRAAATAYGLNVVEQMRWIVKAKQYLKKLHTDWRVLCLVHVLKQGKPSGENKSGRYATYVFSSRTFLKWLKEQLV